MFFQAKGPSPEVPCLPAQQEFWEAQAAVVLPSPTQNKSKEVS